MRRCAADRKKQGFRANLDVARAARCRRARTRADPARAKAARRLKVS